MAVPTGERLAALEVQYRSMNDKISDILFKVDQIYISMPEMKRKVDKHHDVFQHDQMEIAKIDPLCKDVTELQKSHPAFDEGEERRKGAWKRMKWYQKASIIAGLSAVLFRPEIKEIVTTVIKSYLGI